MKPPLLLLAALSLCAALTMACAPTVNLATEKPIEININVNHEVRIKLDDNVKSAIAGEKLAARGVAPRGVEEDLNGVWESAANVQIAKTAGHVGERANGYLGVVKTPNAAAKELVEKTNAYRRRFYSRVARENTVTLGDVEKLAGANRLLDANVGEWIQPPNGGWVIKEESTIVRIDG